MKILRVYTPAKNRKKVEIAAKSILGDVAAVQGVVGHAPAHSAQTDKPYLHLVLRSGRPPALVCSWLARTNIAWLRAAGLPELRAYVAV